MPEANSDTAEIDLHGIDDTTQFSDHENVPVEHINFEFEQNSKLRGIQRQLTVFNDTHCYQTVKTKRKRKIKYRIDIAYLDPRPFRQKIIAWKWLFASLALLGLDITIIATGQLTTSSVNLLGLFVGTTVVALMLLLGFFYYTYDKVYFRTQYGKVRVLEMMNNNPDKASFRSFIAKFNMQIKKSKTAKNLNQNKFLTQELQQLRRLKDETMIPESDYEKAKRRIFKHEAFKSAS
ncbi:MAG: hypothetical protein AAF353_07140 [Pseudomonadota bacterium]